MYAIYWAEVQVNMFYVMKSVEHDLIARLDAIYLFQWNCPHIISDRDVSSVWPKHNVQHEFPICVRAYKFVCVSICSLPTKILCCDGAW